MAKKRKQVPSENSASKSGPGDVRKGAGNQVPPERFPIVGIGASAGGLAALKTLFGQVPKDSGFAFVVVVHLSPEHESHLPELLQPHMPIPVQQVSDTVALERNRVYVIPPNANLDTIDTHLRLTKLEENRRERAPIDHFLRTLAKTHDCDAIGLILTGTGSDGTLGLREIKEHGGLTIVQDPNEAEYDGMPQSAIATGMVDLILPLKRILPAALHYMQTQPRLPVPDEHEDVDGEPRRQLHKVFAQLRARTGRDFSRYKRSTIFRRIQRRMQIRHVEELSEYVELLRKYPDEVRVLGDDLLITVTNFFRDPEVFAVLEKEVVPKLFHGKGSDDDLRVWTVGCATGEEAYSLGMLLLEEAGRHDDPPRIQIFASDLHEHSLKKARDGFYPGDIETDVPPERLKRFFTKENGGYRIRDEVREIVVFAPHNLMSDPPFSRLDLISCRNLMIYLQRDVQQDIIELFHYALRPDGVLVLGTSETLDAVDLFRIEHKKGCIHRKRNVAAPEPRLPVFPLSPPRTTGHIAPSERPSQPMAYGGLHQRMLEWYAPPSALVGPDDKVVHLSERAGRYLVHPGGELTANVYKLVREELRIELRAALHAARERREPIATKAAPVRFNGETRPVVMRVHPAAEPQDGFVLLIFEEREAENPPAEPSGERSSAKRRSGRERELQTELDLSRQRLQAIIEEYETTEEEMKASNEEMQSTNEELRSTMEELETSKEELQSMNEELQTVNQENRHKVEELAQLSSDLQNLLVSTDIATLFLDRDLRILRFTPKVGELFNVRTTDRGRPLADLTNRLGYHTLLADADTVLQRLVPVEREVQDDQDRFYQARVLPYRSTDDRIAGLVISFIDITNLKRAEQESAEAREFAESIVQSLHEPLVVLNSDLFIKSCNPAFYEHFQVRPEQTIGRRIYELGNGQWDIPALRELLENVLPTNNIFNDYEVRHEFDDLGERVMLLNARRLDHVQSILLGIRDITERQRTEANLREQEQRFRTLVEQIRDYAICMLDPAGLGTSWNEGVKRVLGFDEKEFIGRDVTESIFTPEDIARGVPQAELELAAETGLANNDRWMRRKDGSRFWASGITAALRDESGNLLGFMKVMRDHTDMKMLEDELRTVVGDLSEANRRKDVFLATLAHEIRNPLSPIRTGLELMKSATGNDGEFEEIRCTMERQTEQLVRLVDDLMDVSRITQGRLELHKRRIRLDEIIRNAVEASRSAIDEEGHELSVALPEQPVVLDADPHRLAQVLSNLLNNAAKYTPAGGRIRLAAKRQGSEVVIAVEDSGLGIPPEMRERIFEMFTQVDDSRTESGLGIGLSLVKSLVELHGGRIEVDSAGIDQGSTFTIVLPVVVDDVHDDAEPDIEESADLTGLRILVVDDSKPGADMLGLVLKDMGGDVRVVYDGEAAIVVAGEFQPGAIVMDIGMPRLNGYEAARRIREEPRGEHIILIALTGWGQDEDKRRAKEAGFDHHVVKPPEPNILRRLLAEAKSKPD